MLVQIATDRGTREKETGRMKTGKGRERKREGGRNREEEKEGEDERLEGRRRERVTASTEKVKETIPEASNNGTTKLE